MARRTRRTNVNIRFRKTGVSKWYKSQYFKLKKKVRNANWRTALKERPVQKIAAYYKKVFPKIYGRPLGSGDLAALYDITGDAFEYAMAKVNGSAGKFYSAAEYRSGVAEEVEGDGDDVDMASI